MATVMVFILWPLVYVVYGRTIFQRIADPLFGTLFGTSLLFFVFLFPLDLSVAIDAGRGIVEHMLSVLGFYIGLASTLAFIYTRYEFSYRKIFIVGGLLGLLVEQNFLGPILLVTNPIGFLIYAPYIFLTYALYLFGPYVLIRPVLKKRTLKKLKYSAVYLFVAVTVIPLLVWWVVNELLAWLGVIAPVLVI
jgi:hypothetical protein